MRAASRLNELLEQKGIYAALTGRIDSGKDVTFGRVLGACLDQGLLPREIGAVLNEAIKLRNRLAHVSSVSTTRDECVSAVNAFGKCADILSKLPASVFLPASDVIEQIQFTPDGECGRMLRRYDVSGRSESEIVAGFLKKDPLELEEIKSNLWDISYDSSDDAEKLLSTIVRQHYLEPCYARFEAWRIIKNNEERGTSSRWDEQFFDASALQDEVHKMAATGWIPRKQILRVVEAASNMLDFLEKAYRESEPLADGKFKIGEESFREVMAYIKEGTPVKQWFNCNVRLVWQ